MMQLLHAGGMPVLVDEHRPPDISNPRGYFEYERTKWLAWDQSWLANARGTAIKVIAQLVPFLPRTLSYRFIFMQRDIGEIIESQSKMLRTLGQSPAEESRALARAFAQHLVTAEQFVAGLPSARSMSMNYQDLLTMPDDAIEQLMAFLNWPNVNRRAMFTAIDIGLHRTRAAGSPAR